MCKSCLKTTSAVFSEVTYLFDACLLSAEYIIPGTQIHPRKRSGTDNLWSCGWDYFSASFVTCSREVQDFPSAPGKDCEEFWAHTNLTACCAAPQSHQLRPLPCCPRGFQHCRSCSMNSILFWFLVTNMSSQFVLVSGADCGLVELGT